MIKISDEQAAKLGIKSFEDIEEKLAARDKEESRLSIKEFTDINARITALSEVVGVLPKVDTAAIIKTAVEQASVESKSIAAKEVSSAIARAGQAGLAPNQPKTEGNDLKQAPAAGGIKGQWDADANLRDEFLGRFDLFEKYSKAEAEGRFTSRNQ